MNKDGGYVLPAVIEPETSVCFQILVPNDEMHLAAFRGQLWELTRWYNWQRDPEHKAILVADVWKGIYETVRAGDNCEVGMFDIRQKPDAPCIIQKQPYGDTWLDAVNMQLCPPQVRVNNGVVQWFNPNTGLWENVETGDERSNGSAPIPWPSPPVGEDGACLTAENITAYYQSVLTSVRGDVVLGKSVTIIATLVTSALSLFIPPMLYGTLALGLASAALTLGEVGLTIMLQEEHLDNFKCVIYCNAESDGSVTATAFTNIRAGMASWASGLELFIIEQYLDSLGSVGLQRQGNALGITTGHCDDCGCVGCQLVTFDGTPNYTLVEGLGTVISGGIAGNCLGIVNGQNGGAGIRLAFTVDNAGCHATQCTLEMFVDWGNSLMRTLQWWVYDPEHPEAPIAMGEQPSVLSPNAWTTRTIEFGSAITSSGLQLHVRSGAEGQNGTVKIDNIQFSNAE